MLLLAAAAATTDVATPPSLSSLRCPSLWSSMLLLLLLLLWLLCSYNRCSPRSPAPLLLPTLVSLRFTLPVHSCAIRCMYYMRYVYLCSPFVLTGPEACKWAQRTSSTAPTAPPFRARRPTTQSPCCPRSRTSTSRQAARLPTKAGRQVGG